MGCRWGEEVYDIGMETILGKSLLGVADICRKHGVQKLSVFGSVARGDAQDSDSDIDLIAEFGPNIDPRGVSDRYLDFAEETEHLLGRKVDLLTEKCIRNPHFRRQVAADRHILYDAQTSQATV